MRQDLIMDIKTGLYSYIVAGSDRTHAVKDCKDLLNTFPASRSGSYWLDPNGGDVTDAFKVRLLCQHCFQRC